MLRLRLFQLLGHSVVLPGVVVQAPLQSPNLLSQLLFPKLVEPNLTSQPLYLGLCSRDATKVSETVAKVESRIMTSLECSTIALI